jgi:hypothetical protein
MEQAKQGAVVQGERAQRIRIAREGDHADDIAVAAGQGAVVAGDEVAERRLHHVQPRCLGVAELQVERAHAGRDVHHHGDRDALALDLGRLDPPLRARERNDRQDQRQCAQPGQAAAQPRRPRRRQTREPAECGIAERDRRLAPADPPQQRRHQQQKQQRLRIGQSHG